MYDPDVGDQAAGGVREQRVVKKSPFPTNAGYVAALGFQDVGAKVLVPICGRKLLGGAIPVAQR